MTTISKLTHLTKIRTLLVMFVSILMGAGAVHAQDFASQSFSPTSAAANTAVTHTVTIDNTASSVIVSGLSFSHTFPAGMTIVSAPTSDCRDALPTGASGGNTITLPDAQIAPGLTCTVTTQVASTATGTNTSPAITITSSQSSTITAASSSLDVTTPVIVFSKSFAPSTVNQNGVSTLTYLIDNTANTARVGSLDFTENLPSGLRVASNPNASTNCVSSLLNQTTLTAVAGSAQIILDANGQTFFTGAETVDAGATCTVSIDVQATGVGAFTTTSSDLLADFVSQGPASATLTSVGGDLVLAKSYSNAPVAAGGVSTIEYTVLNNSRSGTTTDVAFTDDLNALTPAATGIVFSSLVSNSCGGSAAGVGTGNVAYTGGSVASGSSCVITLSTALPGSIAAGSYASTTSTVTGTLAATPVTGNAASANLVVATAAAPSMTMSVPDGTAGTTIQATFTMTNNAAAAMTDGTFEVPVTGVFGFPAPFTFSAVTGCGGGAASLIFTDTEAQSLSFTGGSMGAAGSGTETCSFTADIAVPGSFPSGNYVLTSNAPTGVVGSSTVTGTGVSDSFAIGNPDFDLTFTKAFENDVEAGNTVNLVYTITTDADNTTTATAINFTDPLTSALAGITINSGASTSTCGGTISGSGDVTFSGGTLAAGSVCLVTVPVTAPVGTSAQTIPTTSTSLFATGSASPVDFGTASADLVIVDPAELILSASLAPASVIAGDSSVFTARFDNSAGSSNVTDLSFIFDVGSVLSGATFGTLPATNPCGFTIVTISPSFIALNAGTVNAGATCTVGLPIVTPVGALNAPVTFETGNISGTVGATSTPLGTVAATLSIDSAPLLATKSFSSASVVAGGTALATITVENQSSEAVTNVVISDDLNSFISGATLAAGSSTSLIGCGAGVVSGSLSITGASIAANSTCTVNFGITVPSGTPASNYTNTADPVTGEINGFAVTSNAASDDIQVTSTVLPTFSSSLSPSTVNVGDAATISYVISNPAGGGTLSDMRFSDDLGSAITGLSISGVTGTCGAGSSFSGGSALSLTGGTLAAGESCTLTASLTVAAAGAGATYPTSSVALTSNGSAFGTAAGLSLTVNQLPATLSKSYAAASFPQGGSTTLTYTISNTAGAAAATGLSFTDTLPGNVVFAASPATTNSCGGSLSAAAGSGALSLSGGSAPASGVCTITVPVTSASVVPSTSTSTSILTTPLGTSAAASAAVAVTAAPIPGFAKSFSPASVAQGGTSTMTFVVDNGSALIDATSFAFTDTMPTGMIVADTPNASTTCTSGSLTAVAEAGSVSFAGGTIDASTSCTITVDVRAIAAGSLVNTTSATTSSLGSSTAASGTLTSTAAPAPRVSFDFSPNTVAVGQPSAFALFVTNQLSLIEATNLAVNVALPTGFTVTQNDASISSCQNVGTVTLVEGGTSIAFSGGTLPAGGLCVIRGQIASTAAGTFNVSTSTLTSSLATGTANSDTITVNAAPFPSTSMSFSPAPVVQGGSTSLTVGVQNTGAFVDAENTAFTINLPTGLTVADAPSNSVTCSSGTLTAVAGASTISFAGGTVDAGSTCNIRTQVSSDLADSYSVSTSNVATSLGNAGVAAETLVVTAAPVPNVTLSSSLATIVQGAQTRLIVNFTNSLALVPATGVAGSLTLPAGFSVAPVPNIGTSGTCTGATVTPGAGGFSYAIGQVDAGGSCVLQIDVVGTTVGSTNLTTSDTTSNLGNSGTASTIVTVTAAGVPAFTKSFTPTSIEQGRVARLIFRIDNSTALVPATGGVISDSFPSGMVAAADPAVDATCRDAASSISTNPVAAGATSLTSGAITVAAGDTCTYSVSVTAAEPASLTNVSGAFTSSLGASGTAAATLTVTAAPVPLFTKAFGASNITQGENTSLTFTLDNATGAVDATGATFTDTLPTGMTVDASVTATNTCGGTLSAAGGGSAVSLTGGTIPLGASCEIAVQVTSSTVGSVTNTSGAMTSSLGTTPVGTATASLNVVAAGAPSFAKVYAPDSIVQGNTTTATYTIGNTGSLVDAVSVAFSDSLPTGLTIAATPNAVADANCGSPTVTAVAGASTFSIAGGTIAAGETCTVSVDMVGTNVGSSAVDTGTLTSVIGGNSVDSGTARATLTITGAPVPLFAQAFAPATIVQGEDSVVTFTIDNSASLVPATGLSFLNALPVGLSVAAGGVDSNSCTGGTLVATGGSTNLSYAGGSVAAGATCAIAINVTSETVGTATNTTGALNSDLGSSGTATAALEVTATPTATFAKAFAASTIEQGQTTRLTFTIDNTASLLAATGVSFVDTFPAGMSVASTPAAFVNNCLNAVASPVPGSSSYTFSSGIINSGEICSVSFDVTAVVAGSAVNLTDDLTSSAGNSGTATATLNVTAAAAPAFVASLNAPSVEQGGIVTLTYTIDNAAALVPATSLAFSNTFPSGLTLAAVPNASTTCTGGTVSATAGASSMSLSGGEVAEGAMCEVSFDVTSSTVGTVTNTSGDLTSSLGNSGTAAADLTVTAAGAPIFTASLDPASIIQGGVSTLTFTVDNATALVSATSLAFTNTFPTGVTVAATPNASTTCTGGTVSASAGDSSMSLSGGEVASGASCEVSFDVTSSTVGTVTNTSGELTSSLGNSGMAATDLTVTAAGAPTFTANLAPASIGQGGVTTLTYTIDNASALVSATSLAFTNSFPAGVTVAAVPNASTTCTGGTLTATAGANSMSLAGSEVAAGASCEVSFDVTSSTVGAVTNTSGDLTSSLGNSSTASASLTVTAASAPGFTNRFTPDQIVQGGTSTLVFTIDNSGNLISSTGLAFTASLPRGLNVAGVSAATSTCGGTVTATPGAGTITFAGGTAAAASSCQVSVSVTSDSTGTLGAVSATLTSSNGSTALTTGGSSPLEVVINPLGSVTIVQNAREDGTFSFSSPEPALNFSITTVGGTGQVGPISVTAGSYVVTQTRPGGVGNTSLSCSDGDSVVDQANGIVTLNVGPFEAVTCTYTSVNSRQEAVETINAFLQRRNNLILSHGPSQSRRLARLAQGPLGGSRTLSFHKGDLKSLVPGTFNLRSIRDGNFSMATSLIEAERAHTMFLLANDLDDDYTITLKNRRFDIWFEAHYSEFKASGGSGGHFGIAYLGADYLIDQNTLAGVVLQFDSLDDTNALTGNRVDGTGWMIGPYLTKRIGPNLIFDGRVAYGKSSNYMSTSASTGHFDTTRFLFDLNLTGNFDWNNWVVSPNLNVSYIQDDQKAFVDSLNVLIPSQKVELGQIKFGPTFSTSYVGVNSMVIQPSFTINGIYNFANTSGVTITNNTADETDGLRARIEANVKLTNRYGTQVEVGANYDGIGKSDFESFGFKFGVKIPLQ